MTDPQTDPNFLREWWQQIIFGAGLLWAIFRTEYKSHQVYTLVYDDHGVPRIVFAPYCDKCRAECQQRLMTAITDLTTEVRETGKRIDRVLERE